MADVKIIAVTGATGSQGGGVVNVMKKTPGWKVRAVTRNPESDAAKKLAADGVEVVAADWNDEASLAKAFEVSLCLPCIFDSTRSDTDTHRRAPLPARWITALGVATPRRRFL